MWTEDLLEICHKIQTENGHPNLTFGDAEIDLKYSRELQQIVQQAVYPTRTFPSDPFTVKGLRGEIIEIDPDLPVQSVSMRGFRWVYPRYERLSDGEVQLVPGKNDIAVQLDLNFYKGPANELTQYIEKYGLYLYSDGNDAEYPANLTSTLYVSQCADMGYEGHQMWSRELSNEKAQTFIQQLKEFA